MKRLLATTTILALSAGVASAEITFSGDARMGIINDFGADNTGFTSRARIKFTMAGESDSGLTFGADFRADNAGAAASGTAGSVFVATGAFKASMGDVDGAAQSAVGQVDGVGLTGLDDLNEINFLGAGGASALLLDAGFNANLATPLAVNGDPTLLLQYATGNLTLFASVAQPSYTFTEPCCTWSNTETYSVGAAYVMNAYKFSIGYESWNGDRDTIVTSASIDNTVVGADATFGAVTLKARYSTGGSKFGGTSYQDHSQWALSATYAMDALSFTAYASDLSADVGGLTTVERQAYGLGASYDLGGGAKVVGGYAHREFSGSEVTPGTDSAFDLGLSFAF